jgi:hypothetical protein
MVGQEMAPRKGIEDMTKLTPDEKISILTAISQKLQAIGELDGDYWDKERARLQSILS